MKICFICNNPNGGFGGFIKNTLSVLIKNGHEVSILALNEKYNIDLDVPIKKINVPKDFKNTCYLVPNKLNFLYLSVKLLGKIFRRMFDYRYISLLNVQAYNYYRVKNYKGTVDLSEYDCVISSEEQLCNYFLAKKVIAKRKVGFIHPDYKTAHFVKFIDKPMLKKLDCVCTVSLSTAETLKKCIPSIKNKVVGVPNIINVDKVLQLSEEENSVQYDSDQLNLITVCRLDNSSKALDRLLFIAKKMKEQNFKFVWRIIGDGSYKEKMEDFIAKNNLKDYVILLGKIDNPIPFVKKSDLFVLQSYYEGYPIVVCESMIVNVPCLVTDFPSAKELVIDNQTGFIVKNDFDSIYSKIDEIYYNQSVIKSIKNIISLQSKSNYENVDRFISVCKTNG